MFVCSVTGILSSSAFLCLYNKCFVISEIAVDSFPKVSGFAPFMSDEFCQIVVRIWHDVRYLSHLAKNLAISREIRTVEKASDWLIVVLYITTDVNQNGPPTWIF